MSRSSSDGTLWLALAFSCLSILAIARTSFAASDAAQVVMVVGRAEQSEDGREDWKQTAVGAGLAHGTHFRTLANSQAALLFPDAGTQRRIAQNTRLQIKSNAAAAQSRSAAVRIMQGKMWSNARPRTAPAGTVAADMSVETPTATMSIRGTEWVVEVAEDGTTQLAVLSGAVDIGNAQGSLRVEAGEAAVARMGEAPARLTLLSPASRVQWISAWRPHPARWAGEDIARYSGAVGQIEAGDYTSALATLMPHALGDTTAALLAGDLQVHLGQLDEAIALLGPHAREGAGDRGATALLAQALARADRLPEAARILDNALSTQGDDPRLLLARGDIALLEGDAEAARSSYAAAAGHAPDNAGAWYGEGRVAAEREEFRAARTLLGKALELDPAMSRAAAELAAVDTFAGELDAAARRYDSVLDASPEDYVALTGRGINTLKRGDASAALQDFLRAGVIEPRYARAWIYSGVAFYQLGERKRAVDAFRHASALDERDPLPHLLLSVLETDRLDYPAALAAAREAERRMPYLKSLNQVANDRKGNANLGTALAEFGLEQWATHYAYEAYSPYWAGSNLFLADRYTGEFTKNSELFKGFITDPTVFGASNRDSSLLRRPGHYAEVLGNVERTDDQWEQTTGEATANGMSVEPVPMAYFVNGKALSTDARKFDSELDADVLTLGLGARPMDELGVFAFFTDGGSDGTLRNELMPDDPIDYANTRGDIGLNFKPGPRNQVWIKAGRNRQHTRIDGEYYSPALADFLNDAFNRDLFSPDALLDGFNADVDESELQLRHALDGFGATWSWGIETAGKERDSAFAATFDPLRLRLEERTELDSDEVYAAAQFHPRDDVEMQAELHYQRQEVQLESLTAIDIVSAQPPREFVLSQDERWQRHSEWNPRVGLAWRPNERDVWRAVAQRWRRPASAATLGAVDTLGVVLSDRLPAEGGQYERLRLQYEGEASDRVFLQAFADHEEVANGLAGEPGIVEDFQLRTLKDLLNQPDVFAPLEDLEETPRFRSGDIDTLGLAANWLAAEHASASARYLYRDSEQGDAAEGLRIPYVPEHYVELRGSLTLPARWLLGAHAVWRDQRYRDSENLERIDAGWSFGGTVYWETEDKRFSLQFVVDNILIDESAGLHPDTRVLAKGTFRL
jgi:Flp pilus assembly protein TadD